MFSDIKYLTKGKRSEIYTAYYKRKKVSIKIQRKDIPVNSIKNEAYWLKRLNKIGIGPKLLLFGESLIVYEFVEGERILSYLLREKYDKSLNVIRKVLEQCKKLDNLELRKGEMHNPYKHILIDNNDKVVMIDFERCHKSKRPKNVAQFCQFLMSRRVNSILSKKKIHIDNMNLKEYLKKEYNNLKIEKILGFIKV